MEMRSWVRRSRRRPIAVINVAMLILLIGAGCGAHSQKAAKSPAQKAIEAEIYFDVPGWVKAEKLPPAAIPGARLFAASGCTACHTYLGSGSSNLGAPDLTEIGARGLGIGFQIRYLKCPSCVTHGSPMPKFASLGAARLHQLAVFLEASKGRR